MNTPETLSATDIQDQALRHGINDLLAQCTDEQVLHLHMIHDKAPWRGLLNCPTNKLVETYELLRRTVESNRAAARSRNDR